jgi:predicted acyltransferase
MVLVNNPGTWSAVYWPLEHAEWHGWTPTDLIFPFFLFIVGAAMAQADPARHTPIAVLRRGAVLVGVGLFMAGFPFFDLARWRVPGVLQRIGVCYVVAAFIWKGLSVPGEHRATSRRLLGATAACLLGYWALLAFVPPPGGVAGDLSAEGNLGAWLDRQLLGTHLWKTTWDPEGLLSSVPAVGTTLLGLTAGLWIRHERARAARQVLYYAGIAAIVAGSTWSLLFPINKSLWTSSYALFTAGVAAMLLAILHQWLDDGRSSPLRDRLSEPFVALGRNALLLFVLSGLVARLLLLWRVPGPDGPIPAQRWVYEHAFAPLAAPRNASLLYAAANLVVLFVLLAWLHRRRWYWSV